LNTGVSDSDYNLLKESVNVIIHCAATVDFKERLDLALRKNAVGTLQLFEMGKSFDNFLVSELEFQSYGILVRDLSMCLRPM
jgi:thioester reductase-like protein